MSTEIDPKLWAAAQSVYEPGSRLPFEPEQRPDEVDKMRAVAVYVIQLAADFLVRRDAFTERTLHLLDEMVASIEDGTHRAPLDPYEPEPHNNGKESA